MVKKLLKYEFKYYIRILLPVFLALIGVAGIGRTIQLLESESIAYQIVFGVSIATLYIGALGSGILTAIFVIIRYFKNLFSREGYLSFTLPVAQAQHIIAKFIGGVAAFLCWALAVIIALCVITSGDMFVELIRAGIYLLEQNVIKYGVIYYLFIMEYIIYLLVSLGLEILIVYTCISIAQTFRRGKVIGAIGLYFGRYMIGQTLNIVYLIIGVIFAEQDLLPVIWFLRPFDGEENRSIFMAVVITLDLVLAFVLFMISKRTTTNKLNLE